MNNYLADTTVMIEHLRGNVHAKQFIEKYIPSISSVTTAELIQGARDKQELISVVKLCGSLSEIPIDRKISHRSLKLLEDFHLSHGLRFLDGLIAATAIEHNFLLVTGNVKDFQCIKELQICDQKTVFI